MESGGKAWVGCTSDCSPLVRVDRLLTLAFGSEEETEIRAATVQAVERLKHILNSDHQAHTISVHIDWLLWQKGEALRTDIRPHHRTLTIFY